MISVFATVVLLVYMETFRVMAGVAADPNAELSAVRNASPGLHAAPVLLVPTVLSVYKPRGLTRCGHRQQREQRRVLQPGQQDEQRTSVVIQVDP